MRRQAVYSRKMTGWKANAGYNFKGLRTIETLSNSLAEMQPGQENAVRSLFGEQELMRRKWDAETKARIVLEGIGGRPVSELCREYMIRPGQYYKWKDQFTTNSPLVFKGCPKPKGSSDLRVENERLKKLVGELTLALNNGGK